MAKNDDLHLGGIARNFLEMGINQYEAHMQIKSANFDTEKIRVIKHWKETVIDPMKKSKELNRGYLLAASIICELCVKDVCKYALG